MLRIRFRIAFQFTINFYVIDRLFLFKERYSTRHYQHSYTKIKIEIKQFHRVSKNLVCTLEYKTKTDLVGIVGMIGMFLGHPDPLVRGPDPAPDPCFLS